MAYLYKRGKKGIWYAKFYKDGVQVLRSLKTDNYRAAKSRAKALEAGVEPEIDDGTKSSDRIRLKGALEEFCRYLKSNRTKKSYLNEYSRLRTIFGEACPSLKLVKKGNGNGKPIKISHIDELTTPLLNRFIESRRQEGNVGETTLLRIREILHKFFVWLNEFHGYEKPNPVSKIKRPKTPAPKIRFLNNREIKTQLDELEEYPQIKVMVSMYIYGGLRREEALWLTKEDVDLKRKMIYIRAKTVGGKNWQPKTKRNRAIPISTKLFIILKKYKPPKDDWYFPSPSGGWWHPDSFGHYLAEINHKHGLDWSCRDFRDTFGSRLAQRGVSLFKISELMGNSPEICRRHYAAIRTEHLHKEIEF